MKRAKTPSHKLNAFLRATEKAHETVSREQAAQHEIPVDRDLSPEARASFEETMTILKSTGVGQRRIA